MNRFHVKMMQVETNSMNYLVLGNNIFYLKEDGLYVRSDGVTERIADPHPDDVEFYASLYYYLEQITQLAHERQQQLTAKVQ